MMQRSPWLVQLTLGIVCIAAGAALTLRPFTSLAVLVVFVGGSFIATGVSELASMDAPATPVVLVGLGWVAAGILVLAWAGITIHALAIVAGISLIVGGVTRLVAALRSATEDRLVAALLGVASVVFGALALAWHDVTVLVIALLVGPRTVLFGIAEAVAALRRRSGPAQSAKPRRRAPRWLRMAGAVASLLIALGLLGVSALIHRSSASLDAFYTAPASASSTPGVLLRSEAFTRGIPDDWRAWRILYTTTRDPSRTPALASGLVIVSKSAPPGPRPVIAWAHGTTGVARRCAPSLLASRLNADVIPALNDVIARGWVLVATDYIGLGTEGPHPYLIGEGEARSVLDSVRAARRLNGVTLENKVVVWGHSQGGHAALWAGIIAPTYAPDLNVLGIAALAPASDLKALVDHVKDTLEGKILAAYILTAYSETYPDVSFDRYVRPAARVIVRATASRCLEIPEAVVSVGTALLSKQQKFPVDPLAGALGERLAQNTPTHAIKAPLFIAQGVWDPLVLPVVQGQFVNRRCGAGQALEYRTYKGRDHLSVVAPDSRLVPDLLAWTTARFAGRAAARGCTIVSR